jgi:CHAD domain-containing protein
LRGCDVLPEYDIQEKIDMADGKWIEGLTPEMTVSSAARDVLDTRFKVVRHYLPLAVEKSSEDPEYVHQLRVGTRRAGAALRVFADCIPRKHFKGVRQSLRLIRQAAGDARDWDVFLLGLPATKPLMSEPGKPALDFLVGYSMGERAAAQVRLVNAATAAAVTFTHESENIPNLVHEPKGNSSPTTFGDLAANHLGELLTSLTTAAAANPSNPTELHQLRILAKRVRYALEIFVDCFPVVFKETVYPLIEQIQEILGDFQDASVGLTRLGGLRDHIKQVMPIEWARLRKGIEGLMQSMRSKIPAGKKAFQKWQKEWAKLIEELKVDTAIATVMA